MYQLEACPECKVPTLVTKEHTWLNNGEMVQARDDGHRVIFLESDNLDPLFTEIGNIIGRPVENILIGAVRRALRMYLRLFVPKETREKVRTKEISLKAIDDGFRELGRPMGYGSYEFVDMRYEGDGEDFFTVSISEPFSVPISAASHCAAMEAILDTDYAVTYSEVGPDKYNIFAFPSPHPRAFRGRMKTDRYEHHDGDFEHERCPTCDAPKALSVCRWYIERGVIFNEALRHRMAVIGSQYLDPIFVELEAELGETIPRTIVEAQRRFTKTGFYSFESVRDAGDFRSQLALRGLGNLRELQIGKRGLYMLVENIAVTHLVVGMMQGIFETAFDLESNVDWEISRGNLRMELAPKAFAMNT
ncbi:MAG: hypothetical protein A2V52_06550 [Actinobacteria bacterium RBG_19FT_COMBO_54_7]|nr:MAG: hypothetical protein A2V52_06550 [Actinobacteria bacterium RBG_19FT_COMBO_54_7]